MNATAIAINRNPMLYAVFWGELSELELATRTRAAEVRVVVVVGKDPVADIDARPVTVETTMITEDAWRARRAVLSPRSGTRPTAGSATAGIASVRFGPPHSPHPSMRGYDVRSRFADCVVRRPRDGVRNRCRHAKRNVKVGALADVLRRLSDEIEPAVAFLTGTTTLGRVGVGWSTLSGSHVDPATTPTLEVGDVQRAIEQFAAMAGAGVVAARRDTARATAAAATEREQRLLYGVFGGELRQARSRA